MEPTTTPMTIDEALAEHPELLQQFHTLEAENQRLTDQLAAVNAQLQTVILQATNQDPETVKAHALMSAVRAALS